VGRDSGVSSVWSIQIERRRGNFGGKRVEDEVKMHIVFLVEEET
jgi:hypothetical protein